MQLAVDEPENNPAGEENEIALIYQSQWTSAGLIVTEAIHKEGNITFLQLWHVGRGFRIDQSFFYVSDGSGRNSGNFRQIFLDNMPELTSVLKSLSDSLFCCALMSVNGNYTALLVKTLSLSIVIQRKRQ